MTQHSTQHTQPLQHILLKNLLPFQVEQSNIPVPKLLALKHQRAEVTYFKIFCPVEESPSEKKAVIQTPASYHQECCPSIISDPDNRHHPKTAIIS